ncbi:MAG: chloride channel protein [Deltaproteobacteria bacterium]
MPLPPDSMVDAAPPPKVEHRPVEPPPTRAAPWWSPRALFAQAQSLPWEQTLVNLVAVLIGVYTGLATGLFANFITLFQLLFFRTNELARAVLGRDPAWSAELHARLRGAPWHFEYLAVAVVVLALVRFVRPLANRFAKIPLLERRRLRFMGYVLGFGLVLYYPLLVLATFTSAFGEVQGGLLAMLHRAPLALRVIVPTVGGLGVGLIVQYVAPESGGHGVTEVMEAVATGRNRIPARVSLWKGVVAGLTIGSGGSCGREGPVVHIGASVGNALAERLGLGREDVSLLLACGGAAGIAASFNAPIAGAMFALEIILGDFGVRSFSPIVLAAVTATTTARTLVGSAGEIARITYTMKAPGEIVGYAVLGALCGIGGIVYAKTLHRSEELFSGQHENPWSKRIGRLPPFAIPAFGGLLTGLVGLFVPQVLGNGYETMNAALFEQLGLGTLLVILIAKTVATGATLGSGAPGGSFFPAVFLGAMLGGALGSVLHGLMPGLVAGSGAYAAVGMGAFVAGATLAPLTGILMIFELTGNYQALSAALVHWALGGSIYTLKLRARGVTRRFGPGQLMRGVLVRQAMTRDVMTIPETMPFDEIARLLAAGTHAAYPVVGAGDRLLGLLSTSEARPFLGDPELGRLLVARDLCRLKAPTIAEDDDLGAALERLVTGAEGHLPVVSRDDPDRLVGILTRQDVLLAFQRALAGGSPG